MDPQLLRVPMWKLSTEVLEILDGAKLTLEMNRNGIQLLPFVGKTSHEVHVRCYVTVKGSKVLMHSTIIKTMTDVHKLSATLRIIIDQAQSELYFCSVGSRD